MQNSNDRHRPFKAGDAESFKIKKIQNSEIRISKTEVIKAVTESLKGGNLGREDIRIVINQTLDMITQSLIQGCRVRFDGFGSWRMIKKKSPYGDGIIVSFRAGSKLKERGKNEFTG